MSYNMKSIKDEFKKNGIFYTPPELAEFLLKYVDLKPRDVYDPTCGDGGLLSVFGDEIKKYGQELNEDQLEVAKERLSSFVGVCGDTLKAPAFTGRKFHLIMANPPFSIKWEPQEDERFSEAPCLAPPGKADYAFLLHIVHYLADDGKAVVLNFPGILYRGNREGKIRQWLVEQNYIERVVHIPGDQFVDTKIATALLVLSKAKTTTDIVFEDVENNLTREVSIDEVAENGYNLSVSGYVQPEIIKEPFDEVAEQANARDIFKQKMLNEIGVDKMICELAGFDHMEYLVALKAIIDDCLKQEEQCKN